MKCKDCPYYWNDHDYDEEADDTGKYCHYHYYDENAPCEKEEVKNIIEYS